MKLLHHSPVHLYVLLLAAFLLSSGCSTHSYRLMQETEQQTREQAVISRVAESLEALEQRISKAQANEYAVYAPGAMDKALSSLESARNYYERFRLEPDNVNKSISLFFGDTMGEKALSLISEANAALNHAESIKHQADQLFAEVNENFEWLRKFQAQTYFPYEYEDIVRHHQRLIGMVADGRLDLAQDRSSQLKREQKALEIAAAQRFYLDDISKRIEREGRYKLERFASLSYNRSVNALNQARHIIASNPRDEAAVTAARDQVVFTFAVAHAIANDMEKLQKMDREEMERWLIVLTNRIYDASRALGIKDLRNQSVLDQLAQVAEAASQQDAMLDTGVAVASAKAEKTPANTTADKKDETATATATADQVTDAGSDTGSGNNTDAELAGRVSQLEKTLSEQINALSQQLKAMKASQQQVTAPQIAPQYNAGDDVPLGERKSLFFYR